MSYYNLYIGDAFDPKFHWDNGEFTYNIPKILLDLGGIGLMGCVEARKPIDSLRSGQFVPAVP